MQAPVVARDRPVASTLHVGAVCIGIEGRQSLAHHEAVPERETGSSATVPPVCTPGHSVATNATRGDVRDEAQHLTTLHPSVMRPRPSTTIKQPRSVNHSTKEVVAVHHRELVEEELDGTFIPALLGPFALCNSHASSRHQQGTHVQRDGNEHSLCGQHCTVPLVRLHDAAR